MWSLSLPQVAATLAAALAGYQATNLAGEPLLSESVFNTVIVLMLVTAISGPVLTTRVGSKIPVPATAPEDPDTSDEIDLFVEDAPTYPFAVVVPIYNPLTQRYLMEMAALLARHESGRVVPLSVSPARVHMDEPELELAMHQSQRSLDRALTVAKEFDVNTQPIIRIDNDIAHGISRTAKEQQASLIIMGWSETSGLRARLLGSLVDSVFWSSHCPVAVMRLLDDPVDIHRVLVPVKNLTPPALRVVQFAQLFADSNNAEVTFLHVCDRHTPKATIAQFESDLSEVLTETNANVPTTITTIANNNVVGVIVKMSRSFDMVMLRSLRRRTAGGLAVSPVTTRAISALSCSMVLFGEPHSR